MSAEAAAPAARKGEPSLRAEVAIVLLALASVVLLMVEIAGDLSPDDARFVETLDVGIACIFLAEFTWRFSRAERKRAFFRKHWWELLASIPITHDTAQALRGLRMLRLVRLLRLLRLVRFVVRMRILLDRTQAFARDTSLVYIGVVTTTILFASALAFHMFEFGTNPNVHSFWDSFWWAWVTITTVGYGDIFPVTTAGRLIAMFLMLTGIGTLGVVMAAIASWAARREKDAEE